MPAHTSFEFTHAICRTPAESVCHGLRGSNIGDPDFSVFAQHHQQYVEALKNAGCEVTVLDALSEYPDSVFVEDAALCIGDTAIVLRPGAPSRFGEAAKIQPDLQTHFKRVINLAGKGYVEGGDVLVSDTDVFIGLSARTNEEGFDQLSRLVTELGYTPRKIDTPPEILHFKTDCGLLDEKTIFATEALAATGCFEGYDVLSAPAGEEAAANLIRVNKFVFIASGFPKTKALLESRGYDVVSLNNSEAAKIDGGLSCMSLRFSPGA